MTRIEQLKQDETMIKAMRESLGLEASDASRDEEIAQYDDETIARVYISWKADQDQLDLTYC